MMKATENRRAFLALADVLIPAFRTMPRFSEVCSWDDALKALDFRIDLREGFARAVAINLADGAEPALERLNADDAGAFNAISTIALATYYMNLRVRELIGYPGQESVIYDPKATQSYLTDGSLAKVVGRGRKYRPTPHL
jgi:hypothetical protein